MKKVKQIYYDKKISGNYSTGLVIELEDGTFLRHQSTDAVMPFEEFIPTTPLTSEI